MDFLQLRQRKTLRKSTIKPQYKVFGVDPSTLPQVQDQGYLVPKVLSLLRQNLVINKGLESEGIFRLSGNETEIKELKLAINMDQFDPTRNIDVYTSSSLIKRWFGELPKKIFTFFTPQDIGVALSNPYSAVMMFEKLPAPEKAIFFWIVDLLVQVAQQSSKNKMPSTNLATVVAPTLMEISAENPIEGLMFTQSAINIMEHCISYKMKLVQNPGNNLTERQTAPAEIKRESFLGVEPKKQTAPPASYGSFLGLVESKKPLPPPLNQRTNQPPPPPPPPLPNESKNNYRRATIFAGKNNYVLPSSMQNNALEQTLNPQQNTYLFQSEFVVYDSSVTHDTESPVGQYEETE